MGGFRLTAFVSETERQALQETPRSRGLRQRASQFLRSLASGASGEIPHAPKTEQTLDAPHHP